MYIILVYDIEQSRVSKANRLLKAYIMWIQNSVFEGEISESTFEQMMKRLGKLIKNSDSVVIYKFRARSYFEKQVVGSEKGPTDNVI